MRPIVGERQSLAVPYPFVMVTSNGKIFELGVHDRRELEEPFEPENPGDIIFVKKHFWDYLSEKDYLGGYLKRAKVPNGYEIYPCPYFDTDDVPTSIVKTARAAGATVNEREGGGTTYIYPPSSDALLSRRPSRFPLFQKKAANKPAMDKPDPASSRLTLVGRIRKLFT